MKIALRSLISAALALGLASVASAQLVTGYTLLAPGEGQAQGGSFNYFDDGGNQLMDGIIGANDWAANLGNGNAQEWVGWRVANGGATFNFNGTSNPGQLTEITSVEIGFNRNQGAAIFLPAQISINGTNFAVGQNAFADGTRSFLLFNTASLDITGNLILGLADGNANNWLFVDEVRFTYATTQIGAGAVPEPSTYGLIGAAALAGLIVYRRRSRSRA